MAKIVFPQDFLWGSATSANQVEGNNSNSDWWEWEHSERRAQQLKKQNKNPADYYTGIACDSYNRYAEDFDLAQQLSQNAHRLSIEWARIEPEQGSFDQNELQHYRDVLQNLKSRGIKTFVTLHHFTNPLWFAQLGGWGRYENIELFVRYAQTALNKLHDLIDFICVINEPNMYAVNGHLSGKWSPGYHSALLASRVFINLQRAHASTYKALKQRWPKLQIGTAYGTIFPQPQGVLKLFSGLAESVSYMRPLRQLARNADFIGIQYYSRMRPELSWKPPFVRQRAAELPLTDVGWEIFPEGLYRVLKSVGTLNKPIYITENGIADGRDTMRADFIRNHLLQVHRAIQDGVPVKGYLHWSLIDNMELGSGYGPKFGLIEIDRANNLKRTVRPSARYYAAICASNSVELASDAAADTAAAAAKEAA